MTTENETFDFYDEVLSHLTITKLLKEKHLSEFVHSDTGARVVLAKCGMKELETLLGELAGPGSDGYRIDTESRKLDGMSFRANDADGQCYYVMALNTESEGGYAIKVLAHEAVHTALKILNDHRLPLDSGDDQAGEPLAYLVGALVGFGLKELFPGVTFKEPERVIRKALREHKLAQKANN